MVFEYNVVMKLFLALICGGLIGIERENQNKAGGLRTHILVALGSTLIMLVSMHGVLLDDPARMAAQVVSGIGFLGTGTILRDKTSISGLTTAASLWVTAGIGLAIGNEFYFGAIVTTVLVLFSLVPLGFFTSQINNNSTTIFIKCLNRTGLVGEVSQIYRELEIDIIDIGFKHYTKSKNAYVEIAIKSSILSLGDKKGLMKGLHNIDEVIEATDIAS